MQKNCFDILEERGFVKQCTASQQVRKLFEEGPVTAYIGFDPTAVSLHIGSLVPIMGLMHLQREGHRPLALVGGGTGLIGDPSGRTQQRQLLDMEKVRENYNGILAQLGRFIRFGDDEAIAVDNSQWLLELKYVDFLREIGRHFSVNRMLSFESYKQRLEKGLSFLEFNYQLCQAYDFLVLYRKYGCIIQMGGDDQWGNIVSGIDLVRRMEGAEVFGLTFPLMTTASGAKMGKTASGAVWLDPQLWSPYDYYQFWVNVDDLDVIRFLKMFTFISLEEIEQWSKFTGEELRKVKNVLAFEATKICHGEEEAVRAKEGALAAFGAGGDIKNMPTTSINEERLALGIKAVSLFVEVGLCKSNAEAAKLFKSGAGWIGDRQFKDHNCQIYADDLAKGEAILRLGKKRRHRLISG
jgi:tyrosyl-tRNA synthetase